MKSDNLKLFHNFYYVKLKCKINNFYRQTHFKMEKNSKTILFCVKIIKKFFRLKNTKTFKYFLKNLNISNKKKILLGLLSNKTMYDQFLNKKSYFKSKFMILKIILINIYKKNKNQP